MACDSRGDPFFIQFFGALLWESAPWPAPLAESDYFKLRPATLTALDRAFFDARLARASPIERRLLESMAACGEEAPLRDIVAALRTSNGAAQRLIMRLADKGLVYRPERGLVAFAVPLFGEYLRRRIQSQAG